MEYQYTDCGLDNVIIRDMPVIVDDAGDEVFEIPNVLGLHKLIAEGVVRHAHGISPAELRFLRSEMGMTQAELARFVKKDHQTIGRWERGETPIDQNAEAMVRVLATERLDLPRVDIERLADRCVPSASIQIIAIEGGDPRHYRLAA